MVKEWSIYTYVLLQLGHSRESIQKECSESDEFENSLEEILERDLNVDSDKELHEEQVKTGGFILNKHVYGLKIRGMHM